MSRSNLPSSEGGRRLAVRLKRLGITLEKAERQIGVSKGYLSKILHRRPLDSLSIAIRIRKLFGVPLTSWVRAPSRADSVSTGRQKQDKSANNLSRRAYKRTRVEMNAGGGV